MRKRAPLPTSGPYWPWLGRWPWDINASRAKAVTAVLWSYWPSPLQEPSVFCLDANHSSALAVAFFVASSILASARTGAPESAPPSTAAANNQTQWRMESSVEGGEL